MRQICEKMVGKLYNIHSIFLLKIRKINGVNINEKN